MNSVHAVRLRTLAFAAMVSLLSTSVPQVASAQLEVSFGMGGQFGGDVYFDPPDTEFEADGGFAFKLAGDYFFSDIMGIGAFLDFGEGEIRGADFDYVTIGFALKPRLTLEDAINDNIDLMAGPAFYVGYRRIQADGAADDADGLALNFGIDLRARLENGISVFVEPGFISQAKGGNDDFDIEFDPIGFFLIGVGYEFQ